jgi:hypothetical protein
VLIETLWSLIDEKMSVMMSINRNVKRISGSVPIFFAELYTQAEFSFAAYSQLFKGISGTQYLSALQDGGNGMSAVQAGDFASKWHVVDQNTNAA